MSFLGLFLAVWLASLPIAGVALWLVYRSTKKEV